MKKSRAAANGTPMTWTPKRIRALRHLLNETQDEFAKRFRVSVNAVRIWEQGQGAPSGPVTLLLDQLVATQGQPELQSA